MANTGWRVLEHGPLEQLSENLWRVQGALPNMSLRRNMIIARRRDGGLVLHSAIALAEPQRRELEALGELRYLVIPNRGHRLDAPAYKQRYPQLQVYTPKGGRDKVEQVVRVDGGYEDYPSDEDVRLEMLRGVKDGEGAMLVNSPDGFSVVLNDAVMNMDRKRDLPGFLFTTLLGSAPGPRVSRFAKLLFIDDKRALREDLERFARTPNLVRLIVAHEKVASGADAARALKTAATFL